MKKNLLLSSLLLVSGLSATPSVFAATCEYNILSEWGAGFTAQVRIVNDSPQQIDGWSVSWSYTDGTNVPRTWDAALSGNNPYVARNMSYNRRIAPNASLTFGFNGYKAVRGSKAEIPSLGGICATQPPSNEAPVAVINANPGSGVAPLRVNFDGTASSDADNDSLTYRWDFGNGDTSNQAVVSRTFERAGRYSVSLTVNDGQVESTRVFTTITATEPAPQPDPEPQPNGMVLDPQASSLYFVSTKQINASETHEFTDISGAITADGQASLRLNLSSIESGIAVRNQRMRDFLFEVATYPDALVTLPVDLAGLMAQDVGSTVTQAITATLDLHGVAAAIDTEVTVTKLSATSVLVQNVAPILISAGDYNLDVGIDRLRNIANLRSIGYTVPVNFTLMYNTQAAR